MKNRKLLFFSVSSLLLLRIWIYPSNAEVQNQTATVTAKTVISVMPQQPGFIEVHKNQGSPVPLMLASPITDRAGNIIVLAGTPVIGQLEHISKRSARLTLQSVLINDRMIPIQASSVQRLPILSLPRNSLQQPSLLSSSSSVDVASEGVGALVRTVSNFETGNQASDIVRGVSSIAQLIFMGRRSSKSRIVQLASGQRYLLQVEQTIAMPISNQQFPIATQQSPSHSYPPQYGISQYPGLQYSTHPTSGISSGQQYAVPQDPRGNHIFPGSNTPSPFPTVTDSYHPQSPHENHLGVSFYH